MSITPESVKDLLSSQDLGERLRGINQLRLISPASAFELVQKVITDSNARVRYAAVSSLAYLGRENLAVATTLLRDRLLNDSEPDVQAAAADSIGGLQITEAFEDLQFLYRNSSEWLVKFSIIAALGELGDQRGFDLLQEALNSNEELIKMAAISSLGELGDKRALPLLLPYAEDGDWQIRYRVAQALRRIGGSEAKAVLEKLARDKVEQVSEEAKLGLSAS
ncbi:MAG: HEAT repeat domain-containing protein [Oscillatoriaceae bacterium SKW80]|nr:HEAT repeat domain-containing protein [Oscillatoriaceae bacterium SKYG93]MCX8122326.1 HEAT repeat domain-containing protein [Oscillatoriaceae bacterium SKW80]MDW8452540.1 HEAT repeat domain-containing protein [Oscillatoriaceae cyanobacterium SKYGB_i_bin93]HIK29613.1 HEAT repeat domain-containing protein [Oscillatoriaceae cyanobacterium M7585_C2015_266]